jgi:MinD superfamily P-loop ATPase
VDKTKCTNCGVCVSTCPEKVIFQHPDLNHVIICDFCMECTTVCNVDAVTKWDVMKPSIAAGKEA